MNLKRVAVVSAVRTPIGNFMGSLAGVTAVELGIVAARAAIERSGLTPADIGETVFGNARQAGNAPNPARQISVRAGVPVESPAMTVNQACASGLKSLILGAQSIALGEVEAALVGGTENMTRVPFMLEGLRQGWKMGDRQLLDGMYRDGFVCGLCGQVMGETAETLARQNNISRREQDEYAALSQNRAEAAAKAGRFDDEIIAVEISEKGQTHRVTIDEHVRAGVTPDSMQKLPAVFAKDGTVTAGNSSGITDGAAALIVAGEDLVRSRGLKPLAWLEGSAVVGVPPEIMGIGPVPAVRKLLERTGTSPGDFDLIELNEAFAAQVLAVDRELHLDRDRVNVNGGAIALGHPIGASGARIVVTLLHELARRGGRRGLATLCVSGGLGIAASFTRS